MAEPTRDLTRPTLAILFILALILASFWILRPFLPAVIWATMIVVASWPLMLQAQIRLWGRRAFAVVVMTLALLLLFVVPFTLAIGALVDNADQLSAWAKALTTMTLPPPPDWVAKLPLIGTKLAAAWSDIVAKGTEGLAAKIAPYVRDTLEWLVAKVGNFGGAFVQFLLTVAIAALMYAQGETAAAGVRRFAHRLGGTRGEDSVRLAGQAVRGVALGVVVTALVQSLLGGLGLAVAGVPFASLLTIGMFVLCIAQLGPILILVPAVIWMYWSGDTVWASALLIWTLIVGSLDNVLRPILIRKGADLPLLLIFAGVIGGLLAFGLVGIFIGPVVLAVAYTLLAAWIGEEVPLETRP